MPIQSSEAVNEKAAVPVAPGLALFTHAALPLHVSVPEVDLLTVIPV